LSRLLLSALTGHAWLAHATAHAATGPGHPALARFAHATAAATTGHAAAFAALTALSALTWFLLRSVLGQKRAPPCVSPAGGFFASRAELATPRPS
jgi:hypothetical protein